MIPCWTNSFLALYLTFSMVSIHSKPTLPARGWFWFLKRKPSISWIHRKIFRFQFDVELAECAYLLLTQEVKKINFPAQRDQHGKVCKEKPWLQFRRKIWEFRDKTKEMKETDLKKYIKSWRRKTDRQKAHQKAWLKGTIHRDGSGLTWCYSIGLNWGETQRNF